MELQPGQTIGDYLILSVLGTGGMGKVYKVRNVLSDRIEALKILLPNFEQQPELADRFLREIKVQASLQHPNIAALHTAVRIDERLLMLMEYVEGQTLAQVLSSGALPVAQALDFTNQVLAALAYAHARGVIHRDVKPANMMLTANGTVKLMDFGIAKSSADRRLTMTGTTMGSLYYMSPEQVRGSAIDARSDLYSVGISLYEMVTGRLPFKSDSEFALMSAHLTAAPPPPISFAPDIPATLNDVILKSIAKDPAQRFQSAEEFRDALYNTAPVATQSMPALAPAFAALPPRSGAVAQEGPISAPPPNIPTRKNKWYVLAATVLMAAVGLSIAHWRRQGADPRKPLPPPKVDLQTAISNSQQPSIGASGGQTIQTDADGSAHDNDSNTAGNSGGTNSGISGTASAKDAGEKRSPADSTRQSVSTGDIQQAGSNEHRSPAKSRRTAVGARNVQPAGRMSPAAVVASDKPVESQIAPETRLSDTRSTQESLQSTPTSETQAQPQAKDQGSSAELKDRLTLLQLRAAPLRDSLQRMRAEQSSQGISMRQDISNAEQRMNHYLAEAAAALNQQSPDTKSLLDKAETAIEELEHFFGR